MSRPGAPGQIESRAVLSRGQTVRDAAEALRRQRFAKDVVAELAARRRDQSQWQGYLGEAESTAVADGID